MRCSLLIPFLVAGSLFAQQSPVPEIRYRSVPDFLKLPADLYFGEVAGVAVNSKRHIFIFSRGNTTGPAYGASAAQLLEFGADGKFLREIGHNLYAWSYAHTVKVDREDNIWVTDKGSDMVVKFTPQGGRIRRRLVGLEPARRVAVRRVERLGALLRRHLRELARVVRVAGLVGPAIHLGRRAAREQHEEQGPESEAPREPRHAAWIGRRAMRLDERQPAGNSARARWRAAAGC
jgi:hypothetical protein